MLSDSVSSMVISYSPVLLMALKNSLFPTRIPFSGLVSAMRHAIWPNLLTEALFTILKFFGLVLMISGSSPNLSSSVVFICSKLLVVCGYNGLIRL